MYTHIQLPCHKTEQPMPQNQFRSRLRVQQLGRRKLVPFCRLHQNNKQSLYQTKATLGNHSIKSLLSPKQSEDW